MFAALDVHTGEVLAEPIPGKNDKNGNFTSLDDLITQMLTYIAEYDQQAKPFKWTYAADPLVA